MTVTFHIKHCLEHSIFGVDGVMGIIRNYLPGGALLPIDIFLQRRVTIDETYQLLYSVACCEECTEDVITIIRKLPTRVISLIVSRIRVLHLRERYEFLGNPVSQKELDHLCVSTGINHSVISQRTLDQIHNDTGYSMFGRDAPCFDIIMSGVKMRVSEGMYMKDMLEISSLGGMRVRWNLDAVIIFGRRRDMKRIRKYYGAREYYDQIYLIAINSSYLIFKTKLPTLGLEEKIVLSFGAYRNLLEGHGTHPRFNMISMFSLVVEILWNNHMDSESVDDIDEQRVILTYEGKRYSMRLGRDEVSGKIVYECGNGVTYSYIMLLLITTHRFLFTYDRDVLINYISRHIGVDQGTQLYLDTPTTRPAIHDLICPPDVFFGDEILGNLNV